MGEKDMIFSSLTRFLQNILIGKSYESTFFYWSTGKSRLEDPRKNRGSKTHGRSVLKIVVMGLGVFLLLPMGLRATFWVFETIPVTLFITPIKPSMLFYKNSQISSPFWKIWKHSKILFNLRGQIFENENRGSKTHGRSVLKTVIFYMGLRPAIYMYVRNHFDFILPKLIFHKYVRLKVRQKAQTLYSKYFGNKSENCLL